MFIAHLPAGYLLTAHALKRAQLSATQQRALLCYGLIGSVLPDFDLLYFFLIDNRQHTHHSYWSHMPLPLLACALPSFAAAWAARSRFAWWACGLLFAGAMLHLLLDSMAGRIKWFYPFSDAYYTLILIRPRHDWWVLNFWLHWSFLAEIAIVACAWRHWRAQRESTRMNAIY